MQHQRSHEIFQDLKRAFKRAFSTGSECGFYAVNYGLLKDRLLDTEAEEYGSDDVPPDSELLAINNQHLIFAVDALLEVFVVPLRIALDFAAEKCDNPELMMLLRGVHGNDLWMRFSMFSDDANLPYDGSINIQVLSPTPLAKGMADKRGVDLTERFGEWKKPIRQKPKTKVKPKPRKAVTKDAEDS